MTTVTSLLGSCWFALYVRLTAAHADASFTINISSETQEVWPFWEDCTTADVAHLALRQDFQEHLAETYAELGVKYVRMHGIFDDDVGIVNGINDYSYVNADIIYDAVLSVGMKPLIELDFMPRLFALDKTRDGSYHSEVYGSPPQNYTLWTEFVVDFVSHLVHRYGIDEVLRWPGFEAWNEPNFGSNFVVPNVSNMSANYSALQFAEFMHYYNETALAVKSVDTRLKFGGPASAAGKWIQSFSQYIQEHDMVMDFFSTHIYPKDSPCVQNKTGYVMQLKNISNMIENNLHAMPIYLSAYGCYVDQGSKDNFNAPHDTSTNAACFLTLVKQFHQHLDRNLWTLMSFTGFTDVWEKPGWFSQPFHDGFGWINMNNIRKPTYYALKLLHTYANAANYTYFIDVNANTNENDNGNTSVSAAANDDANDDRHSNSHLDLFVTVRKPQRNEIVFFVSNWNWPLNGTVMNEMIVINVTNVTNANTIKSGQLFRIDSGHCNPEEVWYAMGYPTYPTKAQLDTIRNASILTSEATQSTANSDNSFIFSFSVPANGVAVLVVNLNQ